MVSQFQFLGRLDNREPMPAGIDDDDNDLPF